MGMMSRDHQVGRGHDVSTRSPGVNVSHHELIKKIKEVPYRTEENGDMLLTHEHGF